MSKEKVILIISSAFGILHGSRLRLADVCCDEWFLCVQTASIAQVIEVKVVKHRI